MANKLIPCRFCNREVGKSKRSETGKEYYPLKLEINCEYCGLTMAQFGNSYKVMMELLYKRWNRVIKEGTIGYE